MTDIHRQIFRHSAVYAVGQLLSRLASVILLPVYTRYLLPADYAAIAILDLTTGILAILIGSGMAAALTRYHFEEEGDDYRSRLWSTGIVFVSATATAIVIPTWFLRGALADAALGPAVVDRSLYFALALPHLWTGTISQVPEAYLRVRKQSGLYVTLNLLRLLANIALNLLLLIRFEMGVVAILLGNLVTTLLYTVVTTWFLLGSLETFQLDRRLVERLWQYGRPLIATALLSLLMHNGDRYILRLFVDLDAIGIYSLAYVLGQSVNTMLLFPFSSIWNVTIYEIASGPNPERVFAEVFRGFFFVMALIMFGVSLFAHPALQVLVARDYWPAADIVPVVCLAYLFFGLHDQFRVPALLSKRTSTLVPVFVLAAALNLLANLMLVPLLGVLGAAWASVITFVFFSFFGLARYRSIARYPYPLTECFAHLGGMIATFVVYRTAADALELSLVMELAAASAIWLAWAGALLVRHFVPLRSGLFPAPD